MISFVNTPELNLYDLSKVTFDRAKRVRVLCNERNE